VVLGPARGKTVAKNDQQKGRSLEEQLASLDALSNEPDEPPTAVEAPEAPESPEAQPANGESTVPPNPWLNRPPQPPEAADSGSDSEQSEPQVPAPDYGAPPPFTPQGFAAYGPPPPGPFQPTEQPPPEPPSEQPPQEQPQVAPLVGDAQATQEMQWPDTAPPYDGPPPFSGQQQQQQSPYPAGPQAYAPPPPPPYQQAPPPASMPMPPPHVPPQQQAWGQPPVGQPPPLGLPPQGEAAGGAHSWDSLSSQNLLRDRRQAPAGGWRRLVYKATAGAVDPGESPAELRRRELVARACTPVAGGHHRVAVMSLKGGVGKTTTTVGLGATLASLRGDRVIAVDANPDRGTLSDKVRLETRATVRDLVNECAQIQRYADVRAYTSQSSSRLEVLASDQDPAVSEAFSEQDYRTVTQVLEHYYSICLTDCGTGLLHSAMAGVLSLADQLVLVSSPSVDGARSASATLDWLQAHGYGDLVLGGVVVLSMVRSRSKSSVDLDRLQEHFEARSRAVVRIPYDAHLEEGAEVELDQLAAGTQDAYLQLAAMVGDGFSRPR
jgi:MinD-like ATPase involved in chromosome partitioning or flagellar assembly